MPAAVLVVLKWVLVAMAAQFVVLILVSACIQSSRNRWNRFRIACLKKWERDMVTFLFEARQLEPFQDLGRAERRFFIPFLLRVLEVLSGKDGVAVRRLYHQLKLSRGLNRRLRARKSRERALAAQEVSAFEVDVYYPRLMEMLRDPMPFVAHVAARGLAGTRRLDYAGPVLDWILTQDSFQQERQIWILEGFGPPLLPWLEQRMESRAVPDPREWNLFAKLVASYRSVPHASKLVEMLQFSDPELRVLAVKAITAVAYPEALPAILPLVDDPNWVIRAQAALALGILAGAGAIPKLLGLMSDQVYDVRRLAALALSRLGATGTLALLELADDPEADPFARDLALERLQWEPKAVAP
jgi:hypothetical protein